MNERFHVERLTAYSPRDAAEIGALMSQLSPDRGDKPVPEELLRHIVDSPDHDQLVARSPERIIGAATLSVIYDASKGRKGWLEGFVTDQHSGIRGVGRQLWDEMGAWCAERQIELHFTSRPDRELAHRFYLKNGAVIRNTNVFKRAVPSSEL